MLNYIAAALSNLGLSANAVTLIGFALSFVAAFYIASGQLLAGAFAVLLAGGADLVDGKIARLRGTAGSFGALLDSSLDRYSDALYYGAIIVYFLRTDKPLFAFFAWSALIGAFGISYVRARSEGLGKACQIGFWERGERTVLIIAALAANNLELAAIYLGVLTHVTVVRRMSYARGRLSGARAEARARSRKSRAYLVRAVFYIATLLLVRL